MKRRSRFKELATERVEILLEIALENATKNMLLAQRQARMARRICMKYNIKLPYSKKQLFCHGCKKLIVPGINARVRLGGKSVRAIKITCLDCGHIYRRIMT